MGINIVLIDFENVQPDSLCALEQNNFRIFVFVGASQEKIPFDIACTMQRMGANAEYVKIASQGKNALDFHIAFYIGKLAAQDPKIFFHIISKDSGFDCLIQHLRAKKIYVSRSASIAEMPVFRPQQTAIVTPPPPPPKKVDSPSTVVKTDSLPPQPTAAKVESPPTSTEEKVFLTLEAKLALSIAEKTKMVLERLCRNQTSKPSTVLALSNTIQSIFGKQLTPYDVQAIVSEMAKLDLVVIRDKSVSYRTNRIVGLFSKNTDIAC